MLSSLEFPKEQPLCSLVYGMRDPSRLTKMSYLSSFKPKVYSAVESSCVVKKETNADPL